VSLALALALVLAAAALGGHVAERYRQPAVLGELVAGMVLGNLGFLGWTWPHEVAHSPLIDGLASLGVILLLFEVGLESTVDDMSRVGARSLLVAVLGVIAPWILGAGAGAIALPGRSPYVYLFLGATLTATSVGITARVLRDLGQSKSTEAQIILGAAVIDDVLGLVILAVVTSLIQAANAGAEPSIGGIGWVLFKAVGFLAGALLLGSAISPRLFAAASRLRGSGTLLAAALVPCFALAGLAAAVGLAPIVGAYAAGLVLEHSHYAPFTARGQRPLNELLQPVTSLLVPVFFVLMGMRVDLSVLGQREILGLAALVTAAAVIGKQVCALGGLGAPLDRLSIGIGMIPRGEVGLIFANLGLGLSIHGTAIVDPTIFSTIVLMVMATTLVTPPLLEWSFRRPRPGRLLPDPEGVLAERHPAG
jgi:Kef-type K+ transport system membrane component KefB